MTLPAKVYLTRKVVMQAVGGWRRLRALEQGGHLRRHHLPGYKIAHYLRTEVLRCGEPIDSPRPPADTSPITTSRPSPFALRP
jgi:hypothetical protein